MCPPCLADPLMGSPRAQPCLYEGVGQRRAGQHTVDALVMVGRAPGTRSRGWRVEPECFGMGKSRGTYAAEVPAEPAQILLKGDPGCLGNAVLSMRWKEVPSPSFVRRGLQAPVVTNIYGVRGWAMLWLLIWQAGRLLHFLHTRNGL